MILASSGAAGLIVAVITALTAAFGLGSERIASDLVAGVSLFFSQIYNTDDFVTIAGYDGKVVQTSLWLTTLESIHGDRIFIRNSDVVNGTIVNHSVQPGHLIFVKLILPASENINESSARSRSLIAKTCAENQPGA